MREARQHWPGGCLAEIARLSDALSAKQREDQDLASKIDGLREEIDELQKDIHDLQAQDDIVELKAELSDLYLERDKAK